MLTRKLAGRFALAVAAVLLTGTVPSAIAQSKSVVRSGSFEVGGFVGSSYGIDQFRVMGGGNATYAVNKYLLPYVEFSYFPGIGRTSSGTFPDTGRPFTTSYSIPLTDFHGGVHIRLPILREKPVVPYLVFGVGGLSHFNRTVNATFTDSSGGGHAGAAYSCRGNEFCRKYGWWHSLLYRAAFWTACRSEGIQTDGGLYRCFRQGRRRLFLPDTVSVASRRQFVAAALALAAKPAPACDLKGLATPHKIGSLVLTASDREGEFDRTSVDCPFVFHRNSLFYMTYVAFDGVGYQTGLASSEDLVHWQKRGCILRRDPASPVTRYNIALNWILRANDLHSVGELSRVDGRYLGVYHAYPNSGYEQGAAVIGLCRSTDSVHWELDDPCLRAEDGADWERGGLYKPCLVKSGATYYLFYNAKNREARWHEQTGVAISTDLKSWKRYEGNPILPNGPAGQPRFAIRQRPVRAEVRKAMGALLFRPRRPGCGTRSGGDFRRPATSRKMQRDRDRRRPAGVGRLLLRAQTVHGLVQGRSLSFLLRGFAGERPRGPRNFRGPLASLDVNQS